MSDIKGIEVEKVNIDVNIPGVGINDDDNLEEINLDDVDIDFGDIEVPDESFGEEVQDSDDLDLDLDMEFNIEDEEFEEDESLTDKSETKNNLSDILNSLIADDDINDNDISGYTDGGFSEEFLKSETELFLNDLENTIRIRQGGNDLSNIEPDKNAASVIDSMVDSIGKRDRASSELYMNNIRNVLDVIRKYNESLDRRILPEGLKECVSENSVLNYDDNVVFDFIDRRITNSISERSNKSSVILASNAYAKDRKLVNRLYKQCCKVYKRQDEEEASRLKEMNRRLFVGNPELKFYETCRDLLRGGELVSICTAIQFSPNSGPYYKFRCGTCGQFVDDDDTINLTDENTGEEIVIKDKDGVHNFYQILVNKGDIVHLHYPRMCKCGSINCLSSKTRKMIQDNITLTPTENSHDKTNYSSVGRVMDKRVTSGSRHQMQYGKWLDVLESKLNITDDELFDISDRDVALDAKFDIEMSDEKDNSDIIEKVTENVYRDAIGAFRKRNNIFQLKKSISKKENKELYVSLALFASNSKSAAMKDLYNLICSYIVGRASFRELSKLHDIKQKAYDEYLTLFSFVYLTEIGEEVDKSTKSNLKVRYEVDFNDLNAVKDLRNDKLRDYEDARLDYESLRNKIYDNPLIYAIQSAKVVQGAVGIVAEVFEYDSRLKKFLEDIFVQCSYVILLKDIQSSLWSTGKHTQYSDSVLRVTGIGKNKDMEYLMADKFKVIGEYTKRLGKVYGNVINNDYKSVLLSPYSDYVRMYHSDVLEGMIKTTNQNAKFMRDIFDTEYFEDISKYFEESFVRSISDFADMPIECMRPECKGSGYFKELFGEDLTPEMEKDAKRFIYVLFSEDRLSSVDILFNIMIIKKFGIFEFTGMDDEAIARNISISGNLAQSYYNNCSEIIGIEMSNRMKLSTSIERLTQHEFLHYMNDDNSIDILRNYSAGSSDDMIASIEGIMSNVKQEFGISKKDSSGKAQYLDDEYYLEL